jgi:hypothetical protein
MHTASRSWIPSRTSPRACSAFTPRAGGKLWGVVAAKPALDHGGQATTGDWSVSSLLSHEALEMFVDPNCNLWAQDGKGSAYSLEVCDPVEAPTYTVNGISVCNFVTPAPLLPTRAWAGIPEMVASDTFAALAAWLVAGGLLACVAAGAAAALEEVGLELVVLELLEQAATISPITAAPMALVNHFFMVMLPLETPPRDARGHLRRDGATARDEMSVLLATTHPDRRRFRDHGTRSRAAAATDAPPQDIGVAEEVISWVYAACPCDPTWFN